MKYGQNIKGKYQVSRANGGCQVVRMLAFYSNNPCLNPTEAYNMFCTICVWKEWK